MLDVAIRVGILNLTEELRRDERLSFLYITHDIASARYAADRIAVISAGHQVTLRLTYVGPGHEAACLLVAKSAASAPAGNGAHP